MQARVPNDQFTMQVDSIADRGLRNLFPCMDTDTPQSHELVVTDSPQHELHTMTDQNWHSQGGSSPRRQPDDE